MSPTGIPSRSSSDAGAGPAKSGIPKAPCMLGAVATSNVYKKAASFSKHPSKIPLPLPLRSAPANGAAAASRASATRTSIPSFKGSLLATANLPNTAQTGLMNQSPARSITCNGAVMTYGNNAPAHYGAAAGNAGCHGLQSLPPTPHAAAITAMNAATQRTSAAYRSLRITTSGLPLPAYTNVVDTMPSITSLSSTTTSLAGLALPRRPVMTTAPRRTNPLANTTPAAPQRPRLYQPLSYPAGASGLTPQQHDALDAWYYRHDATGRRMSDREIGRLLRSSLAGAKPDPEFISEGHSGHYIVHFMLLRHMHGHGGTLGDEIVTRGFWGKSGNYLEHVWSTAENAFGTERLCNMINIYITINLKYRVSRTGIADFMSLYDLFLAWGDMGSELVKERAAALRKNAQAASDAQKLYRPPRAQCHPPPVQQQSLQQPQQQPEANARTAEAKPQCRHNTPETHACAAAASPAAPAQLQGQTASCSATPSLALNPLFEGSKALRELSAREGVAEQPASGCTSPAGNLGDDATSSGCAWPPSGLGSRSCSSDGDCCSSPAASPSRGCYSPSASSGGCCSPDLPSSGRSSAAGSATSTPNSLSPVGSFASRALYCGEGAQDGEAACCALSRSAGGSCGNCDACEAWHCHRGLPSLDEQQEEVYVDATDGSWVHELEGDGGCCSTAAGAAGTGVVGVLSPVTIVIG